MNRMMWTCALFLIGCGATEPASVPTVAGDWSLTASELTSTCPVEGSIFPLAPGLTNIRATDGAVELSSAGEVLTYAADGRQWRRSRHLTLGECSGTVSEIWSIHSAAGRRLSATCSVQVEVRGDCSAYGARSCHIDYGVLGVQP